MSGLLGMNDWERSLDAGRTHIDNQLLANELEAEGWYQGILGTEGFEAPTNNNQSEEQK